MAGAVTHAITLSDTTDGASGAHTYTTGSFTPAANDLIVVSVGLSGVTNFTGLTYSVTDSAGQSYTQADSTDSGSGMPRSAAVFVANTLSSSSARTVSVAISGLSGATPTGCNISVERVSGMTLTGSSAILQHAVASSNTSGTPAPAFASAALTTSVCVGCVGQATNPAAMTAPSGWTNDANIGYASPATGLNACHINSGFTGTTVTWGSSSSTQWSAVIVELDTTSTPNITPTGQSATATAGTLAPSHDQATPGQAATSAAGTVAASRDLTQTGQSVASVQGGIGVTTNLPLVGQSFAAFGGTITYTIRDVALSLGGIAISATQGIVADNDLPMLHGQQVTLNIGNIAGLFGLPELGQSATVGQGLVAVGSAIALIGQSLAAVVNAVVPTINIAIGGQSVASALSAVGPSVNAGITGTLATAAQGAVDPDMRITPMGQALAWAQGYLTALVPFAPALGCGALNIGADNPLSEADDNTVLQPPSNRTLAVGASSGTLSVLPSNTLQVPACLS